MLARARKRAAKKFIDFDLALEDIVIPENCPVLGIKLERSPVKGHHWPSPSLDRIDPTLGYTKDNIRVISYRANTIKNNATRAELELVLADARRCSFNH